jgi:uncharacterized membrane protein
MKSSFFNDNKVLIIGLFSAVALALNEVFSKGDYNSKALVFAAFIAALSFLANNLRGQWATIAGILGTTLSTYITMDQTGNISWPQLIMQAVIALLAVVAPPAKSRGYEHTQTIENAKGAGERIKSTMLGSK